MVSCHFIGTCGIRGVFGEVKIRENQTESKKFGFNLVRFWFLNLLNSNLKQNFRFNFI